MKILVALIFTLALFTASRTPPTGQPATNRNADPPNIIYILADDLGYGDVGFTGQTKIKTPNIDAIAREGVIMTQHYSGAPVCGPSRSCLLTGKHTGHTRVRGNPGWSSSGKPVVLQPEDVTVAEELKRAGYRTGVFGKWGMDEPVRRSDGNTGQANAQGFDEFFGYKGHGEAHHYYPKHLWRNREKVEYPGNVPEETKGQYSHDLVANEALNFIKTAIEQKKPFFAYVAFTTPHYELTVPADSKKQYEKLGWEKRPMKKAHYYNDEEGNVAYAGMVSRMDGDIGRINKLLKDMGVDKNTLVIFTSDNGPEYDNGFFNSNGPFRGKKRDVYEGGIHEPFAAKWPGTIPAGIKSNHPSAFWDFLPTACAVAGIKPSASDLDGISYLNALTGKKQQAHDYLYWEFNEGPNGPKQAIRQGDWKLVKFFEKPSELYNLAKDPGEKTDVAAQNSAKLTELEQLLATARSNDPNYELVKLKAK